MSVSGNPDIITSGLILHLDAADIKSYPRTGTVWYDRSGNGNNGTLVNGVGYSNGAMVFDGNTQYVDTNTVGNTAMTYGIWFYPLSFLTRPFGCGLFRIPSNISGVLGISVSGNFTYKVGSFSSGQEAYTSDTSDIVELNKWNCLYLTRDNLNISYFLNGRPILSKTQLTNYAYTTVLAGGSTVGNIQGIGRGDINNDRGNFNGNISTVQIYNRALSQQEILQNYNATKSRFQL